MKRLLLISLICVLVFSFAITGLAKAEKVELVFWGYRYYSNMDNPEEEYGWIENRVIKEFQEVYPGVEITYQLLPWTDGPGKVKMAIATGTPPNILHDCDMRIMSYAAVGAMADFEDTMDAEEQADFFPSVLDMVKFDGKVYMYIHQSTTMSMSINKLIAEKAGAMDLLPLDREDRSWTTEEFKKFCLKIAEVNLPDTHAFTFHFADHTCMQDYILFLHQGFGAVPFVVEDGKYRCTLNSPEAVEGLEWVLSFYNIPGVGVPGPETRDTMEIGMLWKAAKVAIRQTGASTVQIVAQRKDPIISKNLDTVLVCYPTPEGLPSKTYVGIQGLGVFKSTPEKEKYAKLFCEFYTTRPWLWGTTKVACPPRKSSFDPNSPLYQTSPYPVGDVDIDWSLKTLEYMEAVSIGSQCPAYQQYRNTYAATMQGVFTGELTPQEGLDIVVEKVNKFLDDYYEENPVK